MDSQPVSEMQAAFGSFRLLDLPPELWSTIGKTAVDAATSSEYEPGSPLRVPTKQPAITRVCKALRAELIPYFYGVRFAIISIPAVTINRPLGYWLRAIGPENRSLLTNVIMFVSSGKLAGHISQLRDLWGVPFVVGEAFAGPVKEGNWSPWVTGTAYGRSLVNGECGHPIEFFSNDNGMAEAA